jgi:hypothetical protein
MYDRDDVLGTDFHERFTEIQDLFADLGLLIQGIRWAAKRKSVEKFVNLQGSICQ